jgi:hypothetical protein
MIGWVLRINASQNSHRGVAASLEQVLDVVRAMPQQRSHQKSIFDIAKLDN